MLDVFYPSLSAFMRDCAACHVSWVHLMYISKEYVTTTCGGIVSREYAL